MHYCAGINVVDENHSSKLPTYQKGVLRTNCIDCLDRTNVAQYAYGLAALRQQLHALGAKDSAKIDLDDPLAEELMGFYERMGDTLAHQYGGSAAHNKIFSERRGQWKAATQSQEFFRTLQRYYSNAYMDADKQNAIDVFLGYFQPQQGKPEVWELDSDQLYGAYRNPRDNVDNDGRSFFFKRSFSDGNILHENVTPATRSKVQKGRAKAVLSDGSQGEKTILSESSPDISCESDLTYSRYTPSMPHRELFGDVQRDRYVESDHPDAFDSSNFVDLDWLSSSGNSCEEESMDRSLLSSENVVNGITVETTPSTSECGSSMKGREHTAMDLHPNDVQKYVVPDEFSDSFVHWVMHGEMLCR